VVYLGGLLAAAVLGTAIALQSVIAGVVIGGSAQGPPAGVSSIAESSCSTRANLIQQENCRLGTLGWELTQPAKSGQISGYASKTSVGTGQTLAFSVSSTAPSFDADVYRMGWYGGDGGRFMLARNGLRGRAYRTPAPDPTTGLVACDWPAAFRITVPKAWVSGIYLVVLTASTGYQAYVEFVVRDTRPSRFVLVDAANTAEAYNTWGGKSLYQDVKFAASRKTSAEGTGSQAYARRAVEVSFDRPFVDNFGAGTFFYWEYPMIRWLEREGYDVSYMSDVDVHAQLSSLLNHRAILVVGHDEYWSKAMRDHFDTAVARGVSLGVFAADTGAWAIRYSSSPVTGKDRIIVCYKYPDGADSYVNIDPSLVTAEWRSSILHRPESLLLGAMYDSIDDPTKTPAWVATRKASELFGGAGILKGVQLPGLVGYEYDSVIPGYPVPPDLIVLSASPVFNVYGKRGVANSTLYVARSRATVFNAGTIQWSWGLDDYSPPWHTRPVGPLWPNSTVQRVTAKVLALLVPSWQAAR
jgi:hypothetical protein